ncbi:hypothetical protein CHARACLAT_033293 [Characodon lateralis]|uniref:Uncharacterized protein n=1 Tax=Characodon lateralis TaxID=208331 RepID=A0ABU7DNZ1_9TELE|nr:hypothetical protein [Characodon lateralis]
MAGFSPETPYVTIKNSRYKRFSPIVCGVQPHGKDNTPHTDRFHLQTFRFQMGNLVNSLEIKLEFRVIPFVFLSPRFMIGYTSHSTGCMLVCSQGMPHRVGNRDKTIQHV